MRATILAVATGLFIVGCGTSVSYTQLTSPPSPPSPRSGQEVEIFMAKSPSRDYVEVAYLEARQQSDYSTHGTSEILEELRNEAGQRGCDGLIMQGDSDTVVGSSNNGTGSVSTLKGYKATCIVYK